MNRETPSSEKGDESLREKIERLRPVFEASLQVFESPRPLREGAITVTRKFEAGEVETIHGLVVVAMTEDGPNLAAIDEDGEPTASATMLWTELIDARSELVK